jgi:hypothetical protein
MNDTKSNKNVKKLAGIRCISSIVTAQVGDYITLNGETLVVTWRAAYKGRHGSTEITLWNSKGQERTVVLSNGEVNYSYVPGGRLEFGHTWERPSLTDALMVRTMLLTHHLVCPVAQSLREAV